MKKRNFWLILLLIAFAIVLVSCGEEDTPTYNISFETNCEIEAQAVEAKNASDVTLPTVTKEGHEFKGWFIDSGCKIAFTDKLVLAADITLYAKWEKLSYKVKFLVNGNSIEEQNIIYGEAAAAPKDPSLDGYDFDGWDADFTCVKANLEINAKFKLKEYMVLFMDGSTVIESVTVEHGKDATAPTNTDKTGYTFKNWDKAITNVTGNMVVNAVYEANEYAIVYHDGESVVNLSPANFTYGIGVTLPDFEKSGIIFDGWYDSSTFTNKITDLSKATKDIDLYAKYVTVKYFDGTTEITTLGSAKYEDGELQVPAYEVDGFAFVGWYTDDAYSLPLDVTSEVTSDLNLKALLVKIDYNGGVASWTSSDWDTNDPGKGIDAISSLPEEFEKDFFNYLSDNDLLATESLGATMIVTTFAEFSAVNPNHNGDPKRIWTDCTANNIVDTADGYAALYLYQTLEYDEENGKLKDITGGFLGTEPYKTKYFNVMQHLILLYNGKYKTRYPNLDQFGDSNATRIGYAFLLDGWFYGTQTMINNDGQFDQARKTIPTTTQGYVWDGTKLVAYTNKYEITTDVYNIDTLFAVPFGATKFLGWYIDNTCTTKLTASNIANRITIYAKWE